MPPVAIRTPPAAREDAEKEFLNLRSGSITPRSQIRNKVGVPKQNGNSKVGRNRKHVPYQPAAEVWPNAIVVRLLCEIQCQPNAAHMHARQNGGAEDGKKRDRFGG